MNDSQQSMNINLSPELLSKVENRVKVSEFGDASAYVAFVVEEVLHEIEEDGDLGAATEVNEDQVEDRLKSLGYLDE